MKSLIFNTKHEEFFVAQALKRLETETPVRISVHGKIIKLHSGKSCWRTVGHAKNALKAHMEYGDEILDEDGEVEAYKDSIVKELNIEFDSNEYSHNESTIWNAFLTHLQEKKILKFLKD